MTLLHYPVQNKKGETIGSAITNLDLHDIARASKTYGVKAFYVITPYKEQKELAEKIVLHWVKGHGSTYNPTRKKALELIKIKKTFKEAVDEIKIKEKQQPDIIVTSAKKNENIISYPLIRSKIKDGSPYIFVFGTAWGISANFIQKADYMLEPIKGNTDYNHLSVRSAVSIILDRIIGRE
ncbi:MAG: RNA methyltransferase [Deltaproteobacteria bacterium]|nr:RNA methyltransferase [Deltaproteobacteria bacterium]